MPVGRYGENAATYDGYLTATQVRTLQLLAEGKRLKEIQSIENISRTAIDCRIKGLLKKLGIASRRELIQKFAPPQPAEFVFQLLERRLARIENMLERALSQ